MQRLEVTSQHTSPIHDDADPGLSDAPPVGGDDGRAAALHARATALRGELREVAKLLGVEYAVIAASRDGDGDGAGGGGPLDAYFELTASAILRERLPWLCGLLLLQSCAAIVMGGFETLLDRHLVIAFFVPMIVGTGGNAGNQPGVMTTRALASGAIDRSTLARLFRREAALGSITAGILATMAFVRVLAQYPSDMPEAIAIALAVFVVVNLSIAIGVAFSVAIERSGADPAAGAAPLLTTVADLLGITLLCGISAFVMSVAD